MGGRGQLVRELKSLRKGGGLFAGRLVERIGPALRAVCAVADDDGPVATREKVRARLSELTEQLPADLRVPTLAAFAVEADARLPLYQDRVQWAAMRVDRDPRTVRRRVDEAIAQIAELATGAATSRAAERSTGWHTTTVRTVAVLDRAQPEVFEQRRIVVDQDGLRELDLAAILPAPRGDLDVCVFHGGTMVNRDWFGLALSRPMSRGETHEFAVRFRLPSLRAMRPYLVCVPSRPCELFDLRVRFGPRPPRVWTFTGAAPALVADPMPNGHPHPVDQAGEIHLRFYQLAPGLAYGARWAA
ncbi:hypothetical protein [Actinophytocola sediminis]